MIVSSARKSTSFNLTYVSSLSKFHIGGFFSGIYALLLKCTLHHVYGPTFTLEKYLHTVMAEKPNCIVMGAHHFVQLSESDLLANTDSEKLSSVKLIMPTGSAVPTASCEKLLSKFKNCMVVYYYLKLCLILHLTLFLEHHQ